MNKSGRKLSSKWDLIDERESEFAPDGVANSNSTSSRWSYKERNDRLNPRMEFLSKEPLSGGTHSNKYDGTNNEEYRVLDATIARDTDGSYGMEMSPGFEDWKNKHSQSPKNSYSRSSRSRSRSPPHGFKLDSGVNGRNRMRPEGLAQPCRDFAAGKCIRGSQCHFLHHDNQNYENGRESRQRQDRAPGYSAPHESGDISLTSGRSDEACINFAKGRCRFGASCRHVHHGNSDEFGKVSVGESSRENDIDNRRLENSFKQGGRHDLNRSADTPCRFFAFGNCRNGNHCRFSHDRQSGRSPDRRLRDDSSRSNQGGDQVSNRPKLSDSASSNGRLRDDRWRSDGSIADVSKVWDGPKSNDLSAVSNSRKLVEDNQDGIMGAPGHGFSAWPMSDGWDHSLDKNMVHDKTSFSSDKKEPNLWAAGNATANIHTSQPVGTGIWPGDEQMSPDWNVGTSSHFKKNHEQNNLQVAPGHGYNQNAQNVNALHSSSSHAVGQSQPPFSVVPPRARIVEGMQNQELFTEKKYIGEPNIMDASLLQVGSRNPSTQNMVSKEQLVQLTCLTASLAQILGTGSQLPQLCSNLNSHDAKDTPSGKPVSIAFSKPDPSIGFQKHNNPSGFSPMISPSKIIPKESVEMPSLLSNSEQFDDSCKTAFSEEQLVKSKHLIQLQKDENIGDNKESNEMVAEEKRSSRGENKITKESGPLESMDQSGGPDEIKKTKDVKGMRAFKGSLVEFIKELLKPTWKEGQITKDDYKEIVKKVTDKVSVTVQRAHVPQTQEKIDRYLSVSKPKLNKLIQAYVEKVQKA
ncbi:zinc finger CCCH domain-containing protein 38 isoform X2 [Lotus japonicus]|uniref:zinc finger CCCH domain-containing protein 38 isoform X2 n=1 Tax=Lotus japonicus TaxID=34305 RepID=UPI00258FE548|nr:zinc finger CCCH domain-containing protein 38 isoform X2 [Lotus japonicus]